MSDPARVRSEWGRIWTAAQSKTHIMPGCPYVSERFTAVAVENYPESHVDLCSWCERRFDSWDAGTNEWSADDKRRCARCSTPIDRHEYCETCYQRVKRAEFHP